MALGCVRVDLTVRLGRGVEGFDSTTACILGVALHVSIRASARSGRFSYCNHLDFLVWPLLFYLRYGAKGASADRRVYAFVARRCILLDIYYWFIYGFLCDVAWLVFCRRGGKLRQISVRLIRLRRTLQYREPCLNLQNDFRPFRG